jgi:hypothetical protein
VSDSIDQWARALPKIVAKAWTDPAFMKRLQSNPAEVFKEYGLPMTPNTTYAVTQGGPGTDLRTAVTITIPPKPADLVEGSMEDTIIDLLRGRGNAQTSTCC